MLLCEVRSIPSFEDRKYGFESLKRDREAAAANKLNPIVSVRGDEVDASSVSLIEEFRESCAENDRQ